MRRALRPMLLAFLLAFLLAGCSACQPDPQIDDCSTCSADQVCDEGRCRFKECSEIACGEHQLCAPATEQAAARCLEECTDGYQWDSVAGQCVPLGCVELGCAAQLRECVGEEGQRSCGDCIPRHAENAEGHCVPYTTCEQTPPQASIAAECATDHRLCVEIFAGQAFCEDCLEGYVDVEGTCEVIRTCEGLGCAASNRQCEELPNARCTECVHGYIEDPVDQACRLPLTCRQIPGCPTGQICFEATETTDAECRSASNCGTSAAPTSSGSCAPCPRDCATRVGGVGPHLTAATDFDTCICETSDGYFWDPGSFGGIQACDADGDGWIKAQSWTVLSGDDEVLKINARCTVRTIDRFVLHNRAGQSRTVMLPAPLPLVESQRNDEQGLLDDAYQASPPRLPVYAGRGLRAEELNSLTKACTPATALGQRVDFNDNGKDDIDEWQMDPTLVDPSDPVKAFADFSYFLELHRGWYEAPPSGNIHGSYHIAEKSRLESAPDGMRLELHYGESIAGEEYWRECDLKRDGVWRPDGTKNVGMDFGRFSEPPVAPGDMLNGLPAWVGMHLGSQFKCIKIVETVGASSLSNEFTPARALDEFKINVCHASGSSEPLTAPGGLAENPSDPSLSCEVVDEVTAPGLSPYGPPVYLAAAKYIQYYDTFNLLGQPAYVRGCVNECKEYPGADPAWGRAGCPGYDPDSRFNSAQCVGDASNFGRIFCGCGVNFLGPECEFVCPGANLMTQHDFKDTASYANLAPRKGYWMCARTTATQTMTMGQVPGSTAGYNLQGEISAVPTSTVSACGSDGDSTICVSQ